MAYVRGLSWKRDETLDLLEIWGEKSVQIALKENRRNKAIFAKVAKQMAERGHRRSAEECRTKAKALRFTYRQVLSHNEKPGNSVVTCPYYEQLDCILKGDPSMKTSQSLHKETVPRPEASPPQEAILDLFPLTEEERSKVEEEAPSTSGIQGVPSARSYIEVSPIKDPDEAMMEGAVEGSLQEEEIPEELKRRNPDAFPPGTTLADLSPSSRLTLQQAKRKRVSTIQRVGDMMLQQSTREHRAFLEAGRKEHKEFIEEMRAARQQEKEGTETICSLFQNALTTLKDMSRVMMQSWSVTQERMQGPEQEHEFEAQPSTSGVGQPTETEAEARPSTSEVGQPTGTEAEVQPSTSEMSQPTGIEVEAQPSTSEMSQPTGMEVEAQPSTSGVGQPTQREVEARPSASGVSQPTQGDTLVHCPVAVTPPPQAMSSPTGRPSGSLVMKRQSRPHQQTLAGYRAKCLVKAKKPYSPSN